MDGFVIYAAECNRLVTIKRKNIILSYILVCIYIYIHSYFHEELFAKRKSSQGVRKRNRGWFRVGSV